MQIEAGKHYRTREGSRVGPMAYHEYGWSADDGFTIYDTNGRRVLGIGEEPTDLVAEWQDGGPVRTVTRREIVPGVYGIMSIKENHPRHTNSVNVCIQPTHATADELDAAARTLQQLAEALREETN